ncbi:MAG: hypothetical protein RLY93_18335 [Sumerlaeia bacterium]
MSLTTPSGTTSQLICAVLAWQGGEIQSESWLLKLLYLTDWENALRTGETLSGWDWVHGPYGPDCEGFLEILHDLEWVQAKQRVWEAGEYTHIRLLEGWPNGDSECMARVQGLLSRAPKTFAALKSHVDQTLPLLKTKIGEPLRLEEWVEKAHEAEVREFLDNLGEGDRKAMEYLAR